MPAALRPLSHEELLEHRLGGRLILISARYTLEKSAKESGCQLISCPPPDSERLYRKELVQLTLDLCKEYDPHKVEAAMKKYVPDLF